MAADDTDEASRDAAEDLIASSDLHAFARRALAALGFAADPAQDVADAMVWADLRGLPPHGVARRLPLCAARVRAGGTDPTAPLTVQDAGPSVATLDAEHGWGQAAGVVAMRAAMERARRSGIGLVTVRHTGTPGALGHYPSLASDEDLIGITLTNSQPLLAAPGGRRTILGNQAHAFSFPAGNHPPILFDSSLSAMSTGEIERRHRAGERLPDGVLFDADGQPTTDPADLVDGFLAPIGGHRGFGLALVFELLTSALAGADVAGPQVGDHRDLATPQQVSLTCLAIDPTRTAPLAEFTARVDRLIDTVHGSGPAEGPSPRVPGERGAALARQRRTHGVPVAATDLAVLHRLATDLDVPPLTQHS